MDDEEILRLLQSLKDECDFDSTNDEIAVDTVEQQLESSDTDVVVSSPHQSPRCGASRFRSALSITILLTVRSAESRRSNAGIGRSATKRQFDE